jgi:hypothetical protein
MKDQLFEMLLSLFEQALTHLRNQPQNNESFQNYPEHVNLHDTVEGESVVYQQASLLSTRVMTVIEQVKLTKPAIQFLIRLLHTGMLNTLQFEHVMNMVLESSERYVTVAEATRIVHQVLSESLSFKELLMLEFALDLDRSQAKMH